MLSLIVIMLFVPMLTLGQHIPTLKDAVSNKDTIIVLQKQVNALDGRLTICENAHADSTLRHKKQLKTVSRQRFWTGVGRGIGGTLIVEALLLLGRALSK